jgi:hypothetical protein
MGKSTRDLGYILSKGASFDIAAINYSTRDLGFLIDQATMEEV